MNDSQLTLAMALDCAEKGIPVFPCNPKTKSPLNAHGHKEATTDVAQIKEWWAIFPNAMLGIATGKVSSLFVLDVDTHGDTNGYVTLSALEAEHGKLPDTYQVETASGGRHFYFRYPESRTIKNSAGRVGKGLDIRGDGGYVIAAPSVRADGKSYWVIKDADIVDAPEWLLGLVETKEVPTMSMGGVTYSDGSERAVSNPEAYKKSILENEIKALSDASEGERNHTLFRVAANLYGYVSGGTFDEYEVYSALIGACYTNGLMADKAEVERTIKSAKNAGVKSPKKITKKKDYDTMAEEMNIGPMEQDGIKYPQNYVSNAKGLFKIEKNRAGEYEQIRIGSPITFLGIGCDENSNGWGVLLEWKSPDGLTRRHLVLFSTLHKPGNEWAEDLSDKGYVVNPKYRSFIQDFLCEMGELNSEKILSFPRKIGWYGNSYVFPKEVIGDGDIVAQIPLNGRNLYTEGGSEEEWNKVAQYAVGNIPFEFALTTAFAGPMMRLAGIDTGACLHFQGVSSCGKTTCLELAASVWGSRDHKGSWRVTDNALESVAMLSNDNLLILDEISQVNGKALGNIAYMIANGEGKGRANRNGDIKEGKKWLTLALSSGEESLSCKMTQDEEVKGGQLVRFLDIPVEPTMVSNLHGYTDGGKLADAVKHITTKNYGFAGKKFVEYLVQHHDRLIANLPDRIDTMAGNLVPVDADGQVKRAAKIFALIQHAGKFAQEMRLLPSEMDIAKCVKTVCDLWLEKRGTIGSSEEDKVVKEVKKYLSLYGKHYFEDDCGVLLGNKRIGYHRKSNGRQEYYMRKEVFFSEVAKSDNQKLVFNALKKAGMLVHEKDRNDIKRPFPDNDGKIERCICLTMPDTDVVEEDAVTTPVSRFVFDEVPEDSFTEYAFAM